MKNYCGILVVVGITLSLHSWSFAADRLLGTTNGTGTSEELTPAEATELLGLDGGLDGQFNINPQITGATTANPLRVGDNSAATTDICTYTSATLGGVVGPCSAADTKTPIYTNKNWCWFDVEAGSCIMTIDPDAASKNAMYQFTTAYKPSISFMVPLIPRGAASGNYESIVSNQPSEYYLTITDANTDAADFSFSVTGRMDGATTATLRLIGVSKNASPSGNIDLDCAMTTYTPGTDNFAALSTTGEVTALLTPATQNRPVAVTTSAHTINGGALVGGDIVFGSCEVDASATTSGQMTDFRLWGYAIVTLSANSISD